MSNKFGANNLGHHFPMQHKGSAKPPYVCNDESASESEDEIPIKQRYRHFGKHIIVSSGAIASRKTGAQTCNVPLLPSKNISNAESGQANCAGTSGNAGVLSSRAPVAPKNGKLNKNASQKGKPAINAPVIFNTVNDTAHGAGTLWNAGVLSSRAP
ncbi:unnamed protein product, partial [Meganyctiphanes norvegica]